MYKSTIDKYKQNFAGDYIVARAPGRVNIIGEHTDYNEGFVLPAAIDKETYVVAGKREDDNIKLLSLNFNESFETDLKSINKTSGWPGYILGVMAQLLKKDLGITKGFNLAVEGNVPVGAGLSSSASVECAVAVALNDLYQLNISPVELAFIAQKAEHEYAGVLCGILDQFVSMMGKKDHVIKLDCRSLEYEYEPLQLKDAKILLLNTNVKHSLASGEYNTRRNECNKGVEMINEYEPDVKSLRDVSVEMLNKYVLSNDKTIYRRCKYVVEENLRLLNVCENLTKGNMAEVGKKIFESHEGLKNDYEVSCKELDFLVDYVKPIPAVYGARMMGGGFGGCTINIVQASAVDELLNKITLAYNKKMDKELSFYIAETTSGASLC